MASSDTVTVEIKNWARYNPRTDVKRPSWFRLDHSLIDDADFYDFSGDEFRAFIYILSQASRKNSNIVRLNFGHALHASRVPRKSLLSAIEKLQELQILLVHVTDTSRERNADGTSTNATYERTDVRIHTSLPRLAELWNEITKPPLPKIESLNKKSKRAKDAESRWEEKPEEDFWRKVISRVNESEFCRGKGERGWIANFAWLVRAGKADEILEGNFDNRKKKISGGMHV